MTVTLSHLIRSARKRLGDITQKDLGRMVGTSLENVTAIENGRNLQPKREIITGLSKALDLPVEYIYSAILGVLEELPWEKSGKIDLKDPELEFMFRQVDNLPDEKPKENVKAFIKFTLDKERRKSQRTGA